MVKLVGAVRSFCVYTKYVQIDVEDGTGLLRVILKVLSTQTSAQIKKHTEYFFKQNLKTNSAAVKQYQDSLAPNEIAQVLVQHAAE